MRSLLCLFVMALTLGPTLVVRAAPALTDETIVGTWEAIGTDDVRVFRLEIAARPRDSLLVMSVGRVRTITTVFDVTRVEVKPDGVILDATGIDTTDQLRIHGQGVGVADDGRLDATVELLDGKGKKLNKWRTTFVSLGGRCIETIARLANDGKAQIGRIRSRTGKSPKKPD
ncbi:MAG TPA: hypothetical protein VFG23_15080 [Polyangia bacterium]|nr:hypothetical protein [Polyangia bacterium]